jgi:hypothetical protein
MIVIVIVDVGSSPSPMRFPEHPSLQESHLAAATQIRQGSVYIVLYIYVKLLSWGCPDRDGISKPKKCFGVLQES